MHIHMHMHMHTSGLGFEVRIIFQGSLNNHGLSRRPLKATVEITPNPGMCLLTLALTHAKPRYVPPNPNLDPNPRKPLVHVHAGCACMHMCM